MSKRKNIENELKEEVEDGNDINAMEAMKRRRMR
jgi:hypothetical protein